MIQGAELLQCNAHLPRCSACETADIPCLYNIPPRKRGPRFRSQRVSHSGPPAEDTITAVSETPSTSVDGVFSSPSGTANSAHTSSTRHTTDTYEGRQPEPSPSHDRIPRQPSTGRALNAVPSIRCREVHDELVRVAELSEPTCSLGVTMRKCIDLYMEWIFPISPLVCEAHVRTGVTTILCVAAASTEALDPNLSGTREDTSTSTDFSLLEMRTFSLLTALCSITCCVVPDKVWPAGNSLAWPFL